MSFPDPFRLRFGSVSGPLRSGLEVLGGVGVGSGRGEKDITILVCQPTPAPKSGMSEECPESVPRVSRECPESVLRSSRNRSVPLASLGPALSPGSVCRTFPGSENPPLNRVPLPQKRKPLGPQIAPPLTDTVLVQHGPSETPRSGSRTVWGLRCWDTLGAQAPRPHSWRFPAGRAKKSRAPIKSAQPFEVPPFLALELRAEKLRTLCYSNSVLANWGFYEIIEVPGFEFI